MLHSEIIAVCSETRTRHTNALRFAVKSNLRNVIACFKCKSAGLWVIKQRIYMYSCREIAVKRYTKE